MTGIDKYVREVYSLATSIGAILIEARRDPTLTDEQREDITWQLVKCKSSMAEAAAAMVDLNNQDA